MEGTTRLDGGCAEADRARAVLDAAVERRPVEGHDGKSGARLERLRLADGQRLLGKRLDPDFDLTMRLTGDTVGREYALWRSGILDRLPDGVGHAVVCGWAEPTGSTVVLRDVTDHLAPERVSRSTCQRIFAAAARMHATFAGERVQPACALDVRLGVFAPHRLRFRTVGDHGLSSLALRGWEVFAEVAPAPVVDAVQTVQERPTLLAKRLAAHGCTLLHGDLWLSNIALEDDQVTLLDWALACTGPPALEYAWFLAGCASRVDATREELLDDVRAACGPAHDEDTLRLALVAGLAELGWNKALDATEHPDPAVRARELDDLAWWVGQARTALDAGLLP